MAGIAVAASSCAGPTAGREVADADWANGIPLGHSTVVTIENLSYDPPRVLGLVSDDLPAAKSQEAELRRSGIKRIPPDRMDQLLEVLDDYGFVASSAPLAEFKRLDPKLVLRRLTITMGASRRAFTLPRGPSADAAARFNKQAIAVQAMFNEIVDFRQDFGSRDPDYFYDVARMLFAHEAQGDARASERAQPKSDRQ